MRARSRFPRLALLACSAISARRPARAQSTATLQGTVTDAQSAVMPGVSITIRNTATNQERVVVTDAAGQYVAAALAPGHYEVDGAPRRLPGSDSARSISVRRRPSGST